jgi:hypothetical protein
MTLKLAKILPIAALLTLASPAAATCTWTSLADTEFKVVCTTANETAPTTGTTAGWEVGMCKKGFNVFIAADSGQTLSGSGTVQVHVYDANLAIWGQVIDLALSPTAATVRGQGFAGIWAVVTGGRLAIVPVSVGVSSGGFTAHVTCN